MVALETGLHVVARVYLAKGALVQLLRYDVPVLKYEAFHFLDDGDGAVFQAALF